jgi:putative NADPH-quinone reductase
VAGTRNFARTIRHEEEREGQFRADVAAEWNMIGDAQFIVLVYPTWIGAPRR